MTCMKQPKGNQTLHLHEADSLPGKRQFYMFTLQNQ